VIAEYEARDPEPVTDEPETAQGGPASGRLAGWLLIVALLLLLLSWGVL
jgi:hypothetical protein